MDEPLAVNWTVPARMDSPGIAVATWAIKVTVVPTVIEEFEDVTVVVVMPSPVPIRSTDCALSTALSENVRVTLAPAGAVGVNVMLTAQVPLGAIVAPLHVFELIANSVAFSPERVTPFEPKIKLASPLLETVMVWGRLDVFTTWLKVRLEAESMTAGAAAVGLTSNTVPSCRLDPPTSVVL